MPRQGLKVVERQVDPVTAYMLSHKNASLDQAKKAVAAELKNTSKTEVKQAAKTETKKPEVKAEVKKSDVKPQAKVEKAKSTAAVKSVAPVTKEKPLKVNVKPTVEDKVYTLKEFVAKASEPVKLISLKDANNKLVEGFQGVINTAQNKVVSVVTDKYNLLPNKNIVEPIVNFLEKKNVKFSLDRFTFSSDQRMRMHFTFPDMKIKDDTKDGILSSLFVHNSYNMTESFRMTAGAMRQVCSNGMVVGSIIKSVKMIHQAEDIQEFVIANLESTMNNVILSAKKIEARIKELTESKTCVTELAAINSKFGPAVFTYVLKELKLLDKDDKNSDSKEVLESLTDKQLKDFSQWKIYNSLTYYISHMLLQRYRVDYLNKVSKLYSL